MKEKTHLVRNRCLFSIVIIVIYFICHRIPLNGIDMSAYDNLGLDLGAVLSLAVNGSNKQCYVMSLGISPYITASLVISILFAMRSKEARARTSPKAMNYWITALTFIVTLIQSVFYALNLKYVDRNVMSVLLVIFELMAGASIAQYLLMKNKKYGVGGFAPIIMVNMTETCRRSEIFRNTEFPFKALPFIPVTIQFIPGSSRLCFHFITLAVFQFPPVTVKGISIGMADKLENILLYRFVIYNFAMHSVFMIFIR